MRHDQQCEAHLEGLPDFPDCASPPPCWCEERRLRTELAQARAVVAPPIGVRPFGYLTQTSSETNPPHGWSFRFTDGEVPIFAAQQMEQLRAERDALRADAERYRWLRGGPDVAPHSVRWACWEIKVWKGYWCPLANDELDAAIDVARAKEQRT